MICFVLFSKKSGDGYQIGRCILPVIIHQIFFARAIGLNASRDAAKTGEYQMIFPK